MVIGVQFAPFIPPPPYAHGSAYPPPFFVLAALARSSLERDWVFYRVPRAATHTEPIPHEDARDDRKLTHGGLEPCSPPENPTTTTVRSPAPRPRRCPNHTIQHAYTRCDEQVRPLHTIVLMLNIITCLLHNGDGGVEP